MTLTFGLLLISYKYITEQDFALKPGEYKEQD